jgi:hypothetical protein
MNEFFTWDMLTSFSGITIATTVITGFIKSALKKIPTQITSYFVAVFILLIGGIVMGNVHHWHDFVLVAMNGIIISLTSNGCYAAVTRKQEKHYGKEQTLWVNQ